MQIETFTGGIFDTNCFYLPAQRLLIDAPQDCAAWLTGRGAKVETLLLTHGHIDHVWDAARIQREHGCRVGYHVDGEEMITQPDFFKSYGFGWEIAPIRPDWRLDETPSETIAGVDFQILLVPGHCPGSLCFLAKETGTLFAGDTLFASGVGRWDLPGGDRDLLFRRIKTKLFALDDQTTVLPGHGPATKIGIERQNNPYVGEGAHDPFD